MLSPKGDNKQMCGLDKLTQIPPVVGILKAVKIILKKIIRIYIYNTVYMPSNWKYISNVDMNELFEIVLSSL